MEEEILRLYQEPGIGASYTNTYGEENICNLLNMYHSLDDAGMQQMIKMVLNFSQSTDLATSFVSVGVLHEFKRRVELRRTRSIADPYLLAQ